MIRRPPRSTQSRSSAASDVYKRQVLVPFQRSSGVASLYAASNAVNLLDTSAANYCFLFLAFLEIQRRNAVLSLSFIQHDFHSRHEQLMICVAVCSWIRATVHQACFSIFAQWRCSLSDAGYCHQERFSFAYFNITRPSPENGTARIFSVVWTVLVQAKIDDGTELPVMIAHIVWRSRACDTRVLVLRKFVCFRSLTG